MTAVPTGSGSGASVASASSQPPSEERSLGQIVGDITSDLTTLMRQELDLAKTELKEEATKFGAGAGMLAGAGVAGHFVLIFGSLALMFGLDTFLPLWLAALIVMIIWAVVAAVLALSGRKAIKAANPQLPQTQESLKEDARWATAQKS